MGSLVGKSCSCLSISPDLASLSCLVAASCNDQVKNGEETAVDCGGSTCPKCEAGLACNTDSDCASLNCNNATNLCVAGKAL